QPGWSSPPHAHSIPYPFQPYSRNDIEAEKRTRISRLDRPHRRSSPAISGTAHGESVAPVR
ncbi:MAG: hypothetical protein ACYSVY_12400, partial [Planctomycetota bacterium]